MRLALLTDLHFGFHREALVAPLAEAIRAAKPDLVVCGGDLAQRARPALFAQATAFLGALGAPWLATPGNHDIPLLNLPARLLWPFSRYDAVVPTGREPRLDLPALTIVAVNTTWPLRWRRGMVADAQIARVEAVRAERPDVPLLVVQHHPTKLLGGETKELMVGAGEARRRYEAAGVDILFTGHIHAFAAGLTEGGMLEVHGASALCARPEDPANEVALLDLDARALRLTRLVAQRTASAWEVQPVSAFARRLRR